MAGRVSHELPPIAEELLRVDTGAQTQALVPMQKVLYDGAIPQEPLLLMI